MTKPEHDALAEGPGALPWAVTETVNAADTLSAF